MKQRIKIKKIAKKLKMVNKEHKLPSGSSTNNVYENLYKNLSSNCKLMIPIDEFENYISSGNTLLDEFSKKRKLYMLNEALEIRNLRNTTYFGPETDEQFIKAKENKRLYEMINIFTNNMAAEIVMIMIKYNKPDNIILDFIKSQYNHSPQTRFALTATAKLADKIHKYTNHVQKPKILDVGTGNGKKLLHIKNFIDCDIYGADIENWGPYSKKRNLSFPYRIITTNPYHIPYESNMFDCITLILTLHHNEDIIETLNECIRLLKDDGIISIIEHDVWWDSDNMIIDLQHRIYQHTFNEPPVKRGCYYNFFEWDIIFNKCGMVPIYGYRISSEVSFNIRYDDQFIGIYKKK